MNISDYTYIIGGALKWIFPPGCAVCGELLPLDGGGMFCGRCAGALAPISGPVCGKCGRPVRADAAGTVCGDCAGADFSFRRNIAVYPYEGAVRDFIHRFKYSGHPEYARYIGGMMAERLAPEGLRPDAVIPVPMFWHKRLVRGFNQAELLAQEIAGKMGVLYMGGALLRVRNTTPQSRLSGAERAKNVENAFQKNKKADFSGVKSVLLVDDIFTTGSTLNACACALIKSGARDVTCCTACA